MKVKVIGESGRELLKVDDLRVNSTIKTILNKVKVAMKERYDCNIRVALPEGKIDYATGKSDIKYCLFGDNLPCKYIKLEREL